MTGANYMGGRRNAAKFRLKDPTLVAHRLHFGIQKRLLGLGKLSLRVPRESVSLNASQAPMSIADVPRAAISLASASKGIGLTHARQDHEFPGRVSGIDVFRTPSSPSSSSRIIKRPWDRRNQEQEPFDNYPRKRVKAFHKKNASDLSYKEKLDRILQFPDLAGIAHLQPKFRSSDTDASHNVEPGSPVETHRKLPSYDHRSDSPFFKSERSDSIVSTFSDDQDEPIVNGVREGSGSFRENRPRSSMAMHDSGRLPSLRAAKVNTQSSHIPSSGGSAKENIAPAFYQSAYPLPPLPTYSTSSSRLSQRPALGTNVPSLFRTVPGTSRDLDSDAHSAESLATRLPSPRTISSPSQPAWTYVNMPYSPDELVLSSSEVSHPHSKDPYQHLGLEWHSTSNTAFSGVKGDLSDLPPSSLPVLSDSDSLMNCDFQTPSDSAAGVAADFSFPGESATASDEYMKPKTAINPLLPIPDAREADFPGDPFFRAAKVLGLRCMDGAMSEEDARYPFGRIDANSTTGVGFDIEKPQTELGYRDSSQHDNVARLVGSMCMRTKPLADIPRYEIDPETCLLVEDELMREMVAGSDEPEEDDELGEDQAFSLASNPSGRRGSYSPSECEPTNPITTEQQPAFATNESNNTEQEDIVSLHDSTQRSAIKSKLGTVGDEALEDGLLILVGIGDADPSVIPKFAPPAVVFQGPCLFNDF